MPSPEIGFFRPLLTSAGWLRRRNRAAQRGFIPEPSLLEALGGTLTRRQPVDWTGAAQPIDLDMPTQIGIPAIAAPRVFICGLTSLVEETAQSMLALGHQAVLIKA